MVLSSAKFPALFVEKDYPGSIDRHLLASARFCAVCGPSFLHARRSVLIAAEPEEEGPEVSCPLAKVYVVVVPRYI